LQERGFFFPCVVDMNQKKNENRAGLGAGKWFIVAEIVAGRFTEMMERKIGNEK